MWVQPARGQDDARRLTVPDARHAWVGEDVVFVPVCKTSCLCEVSRRKRLGERGVVNVVDVHIIKDLTERFDLE